MVDAGHSEPKFLDAIIGTARSWNIVSQALFWFFFFCVAILLLMDGAWRGLMSTAITGATSFHFIAALTAFNAVMVLVLRLLCASRKHGWPGAELGIIRFSVEGGVALTLFGCVTAVVVSVWSCSLQPAVMMVLAVFPALFTWVNLSLYVTHDRFLGEVEEPCAPSARKWPGGLMTWAGIAGLSVAVLVVLIWVYPRVMLPVAKLHEAAMKPPRCSSSTR